MGDLEVGWAKLFELRQALARIRRSGKPVVVYFESGPADAEYYLASAADWLVCPPVSVIALDGLQSEATFYRRAMDKLGIGFEFERIGKHKGAVEPFSQDTLSDAAREARDAILDDVFNELTRSIAAGRSIPVDRVIELIDRGPLVSVEAKDAGLVDQIAYEDELDGIVREKIARHARRVDLRRLAERKYHRYAWGPIPKVAVIFAEGTILGGADRNHLLLGEIMGARTIAGAIRAAREDRDVKAIVLRIDSPGGDGIASDLIWHEAKKTIGVKPLVVSMSDVAASGGYYIACPADSIFAAPTTITGSIGVFAGKITLAGLYDKIGVTKETSTRGAHADMNSPNRPFTETEHEIVRHQVTMFYDNFLRIVADGRRRTTEQVDSIGQGRVWTGKAAQTNGLVDALGGLPRAISSAAQMAGIEHEDYRVSILPQAPWALLEWPSPLGIFGLRAADLTAELSDVSNHHLWYLLLWHLVVR